MVSSLVVARVFPALLPVLVSLFIPGITRVDPPPFGVFPGVVVEGAGRVSALARSVLARATALSSVVVGIMGTIFIGCFFVCNCILYSYWW